ncbi:MAG TPA: DUF1549 and DUF1553 domain-containing protein [Planctomycetaceae bacterium]|nr:DUF1549 and DUF1553 domain-containing protein [Planctomycetaceae bacterium]
MTRRASAQFLLVLAALACLETGPPLLAANAIKGLGDPGDLKALNVEQAAAGASVVLRGSDARQQLCVTGVYSTGQLRDLTRSVHYSADPAGIVEIDAVGLVTPLRDGAAHIRVSGPAHASAEFPVRVERFAHPLPINFKNQIVPIFTKLGCNSGGCHGKASGQNGFKLSLLGFYPEDDYEFLVKESRGRRLFPTSPSESLLLLKPSGRSPHGGGKRMDVGSYEYRMLSRWIEQGMPYGSETDPAVVKIECQPAGRVMERGSKQQITVIAHYSDGTIEDVTRMALFEANETEMAEASSTGLVKTLDLAGQVAIMARYQGQVATFRSTIPLGAAVAKLPSERNAVDRAVFSKLKVLGIPPSPLSDDATFLRRVSIDIAGTTPTEREVTAFLADRDPAKRDKLIDRLLDSPAYADNFANKWNLILRNKKRTPTDTEGTYEFYEWIWNSLYENKPFDHFVRDLLTAAGDPRVSPAAIWYREVDEINEQVEDTAQLFLGLRMQCARCHHHPFEKWSQDDYYGFSAFFSRVARKPLMDDLSVRMRERRLYHNEGIAEVINPRTGKALRPTTLGGKPLSIPADRDPRVQLADWMSTPTNPFFARSLVNRYWKHFFSRGIVEPEDDMRETNPPSNPELLDALSANFVKSGFDLKELVRTICRSSTYQLSAVPNDFNTKDRQNFSRYYPRRLGAESLYDAFHRVTATTQPYAGLPAGTHAMQLPDPAVGPYFLKVFGQPQGDTACECERSQDANLAQSLHLLNSSEVQDKIASPTGRAAQLAVDKRPIEVRIRELYRWVYSREPNADELHIAEAHLAKHTKDAKSAYEDIVWALINTKEFLFNH